MNIFKNFSGLFEESSDNPYRYSFSRREHYQSILNPRDIADLVNKYMALHNNRHDTAAKITFGGVEFGTKLSDFLSTNNKPRYVIENNHSSSISHSTLFYKEKLGKHKATSQFHFVDELFLWGMYLFNNYLQANELKEVEKVLVDKYGIAAGLNLKDIIIKDNENNMIQLKSEVYTSIHYMTGNKQLVENIKNKMGNHPGMVRIPTDVEQNALFDKL